MKLPKNYHPDFRVPGKKPVGPVEVDRTNWMLKPPASAQSPNNIELISAHIFQAGDKLRDFMRPGEKPTLISDEGGTEATFDIGANGLYLNASSSGQCLNFENNIVIGGSNSGYTLSALIKFPMASADPAGLNGIFGDDVFYFYGTTLYADQGSAAVTFNPATLSPGAHRITVTAYHNGVSEEYRFFVDGKFIGSDTAGNLPITETVHGIGNVNISLNRHRGNFIYDAFIWDGGALSDAAVMEHYKNPYQLLKPANDFGYFIPSGGGGTTLNADSGTFAQTGTDASLKADRLLSAISGSYTATTDAVNLLADRIIAAATGGYTAGGQDASLLADRTVNAGAGSYTLTGQDVALLKQASLVMAAGSGAFALNTQSVQLLFNRVMPAASGSITLTGQDVTLQYVAGSTLVAGSGDFLASGGDVALVVDRKMQAATGSLTAVYDDAGLVRGYVMDATGENLTLTGQDLNLLLDRALQAGTATFTETGSPVVLLYSGVGLFPDLEGEITLVSVTPKITLQSKTPKITVH